MNPPLIANDNAGSSSSPHSQAVKRLTALLPNLPWFGNLGRGLTPELRQLGHDYASALGFSNIELAPVQDWQEAAAALETHDWNSPAWEAEEQLRAALSLDVSHTIGEDRAVMVTTRLAHDTARAIEANLSNIMERGEVTDESLQRAALGAGVQATHCACLALLAGAEEDHPFILKFRLFELGRWPLGLTGNSLHLW